jgi:hypothetical protein
MASPAPPIDSQVRSKIAAKLAEALCTKKPSSSSSNVDPAVARELADEVEHEMSAAIRTTKEYTAKGRSLVFNLTKNNELRRRVLQRQISPAKLVSATAKELAPDQIQQQRAASVDRYYATRQVGATELVVGWQAGTSGKLEWSGQEEKSGQGEKSGLASGLDGAAPELDAQPHTVPDDTLLDAAYSPTSRPPPSAARSVFMRTLRSATLLGVGLAEATSDAWDVDLTGEVSEDAVRVADAMVCVREIADGLS